MSAKTIRFFLLLMEKASAKHLFGTIPGQHGYLLLTIIKGHFAMPLKLIKKLPRNIVKEFIKWRGSLAFLLNNTKVYLQGLIVYAKTF
jgi:hypothetical protein